LLFSNFFVLVRIYLAHYILKYVDFSSSLYIISSNRSPT